MRRRALRKRYGHATSGLAKRFTVARVRLNSGGYDRRGRYYGSGAPLYDVTDEQDGLSYTTRAADAAHAREQAIAHWTKTQSYSGEYGRKVWSPSAETIEEKYYP